MSITKTLTNITVIAVLLYAAFLLLLFFMQGSLVFPAPPKNRLLYDKVRDFSADLDSGNLQGWKVPGAKQGSDLVAVYFGGNGEDVAATIPSLKKIPVSIVYTFNYRGYGLSTGAPSETALYQDAAHIFDAIKKENPNSRIVIIGYSLGSGVAGYLASRTDASMLVLLAPLYSIERIAKENFSALIPAAIIKNKFNLSEHAKSIKAKTLVICAEKDTVINNTHSRETYANLPGFKKISFIKNVGHNDLFTQQATFNLMADFFAGI